MRTRDNKYKSNKWKDKLRTQQQEKKYLQKKVQRLEERCQRYKKEKKVLEAALKSREKILMSNKGAITMGKKPQRHQYGVGLIFLAIYFQTRLGLSYRKVQAVLCHYILLLGLEISTPCIGSIRHWGRKAAYYRLNDVGGGFSEGDKILIIDECAGIGQEKLLMVLGLPSTKLVRGRSLNFMDVEVLALQSRKSWRAEQVQEVLKRVQDKMQGEILYVISDRCSVLLKACKLSNCVQIPDCSHLMANCLERYYAKDPTFLQLQGHLGKIRQKWVNSAHSALIAPNMRTKARFLNLFEIVKWMNKILAVWGQLDEEAQQTLSFLQEYKDLIRELNSLTKCIKEISKELKTNGMDQHTAHKVGEICKNAPSQTPNMLRFAETLQNYIQQCLDKLPREELIYCSSDIIESFFGKFKYRSNQGVSKGISDDMMVMSLFTDKLSKSEVCQAMEKVTIEDVQIWVDNNTIPSFAKNKNSFWRNLGTIPEH